MTDVLPDAIIVDCDGTLSSSAWREYLIGDPPRWDDFHEALTADSPIRVIVDLVNYLAREKDVTVILLTSRNEGHRYITEFWMAEQQVEYHTLLMRPNNVRTGSAACKRALYEEHIEGRYNVILAMDDHDGVIEMWQELGIPILRCVDPGHEPLYRDEPTPYSDPSYRGI